MREGVEAGHSPGEAGVTLIHAGERVITLVTRGVAETLGERVGLDLELCYL